MRILCASDLHGDVESAKRLSDSFTDEDVDLVLYAGDFTTFGPAGYAAEIVDSLRKITTTYAVHGNCDPQYIIRLLEEKDVSLHNRWRKFMGYNLFGFGSSNFTPSRDGNVNFEEEIREGLGAVKSKENMILLTHAPPMDTRLDRIHSGKHIGSVALRGFIEEHQPLLAVCGHIHEARGVDKIGGTAMVNPGTADTGYAIADVDGKKVKVEMFDIQGE